MSENRLAWVTALPLGACWRTLVTLWALYADFSAAGPALVYPTRARIAADSGQTLGAVKKHLAELTEKGWVRREGRSRPSSAEDQPRASKS